MRASSAAAARCNGKEEDQVPTAVRVNRWEVAIESKGFDSK